MSKCLKILVFSLIFSGLVGLTGCEDALSPLGTNETLAEFEIVAPEDVTEYEPFEVTITAVGSAGTKPFRPYIGQVELTASEGHISPSKISLEEGIGTAPVVLEGGHDAVTISAISPDDDKIGTFTVFSEGAVIRGDPDDALTGAVGDIVYEPDYTSFTTDHPDLPGLAISFNTVAVVFKLGTTVRDANRALRDVDAELVGSIGGIEGHAPATLMLRLSTIDHPEMEIALQQLAGNPNVYTAVQDILIESDALASPSNRDAQGDGWWKWSSTPRHGNWGSEHARIPQMWNVGHTPNNVIHVGVVDGAFRADHVDVPFSTIKNPAQETDSLLSENHGTHVAGIIGATFGINPQASLHGISRLTYGSSIGMAQLLVTVLEENPKIELINASLGIPWLKAGMNPNDDARSQRLVRQQAEVLWPSVRRAQTKSPRLMIVTSAGNDSGGRIGDVYAGWNDPYAYLAIQFPDSVPNTFLAVEAHNVDGSRASFSNTGANLSAPGVGIMSAVHSTPYRSYPCIGSGRSAYCKVDGTSMAAPHVVGLISYLRGLEPTLTGKEVFDILQGTSAPSAYAPQIDAYAAALDIDRIRGNRRMRTRLLDVTGDGRFGHADIERFIAAFERMDGSPSDSTIHSRYDLNGDVLTGGNGKAAFDLNASGNHGTVTQMIEGIEVTFDERSVTDLDVLCYYAYHDGVYQGDADERREMLADRCVELPDVDDVVLIGSSPDGTFDRGGGKFRIMVTPRDENGDVILDGVSASNFTFSNIRIAPVSDTTNFVSDGVVDSVTVTAQRPEAGKASSLALTFDASGSMSWEDPHRLSIEAGKEIVNRLGPDDQAAVLTFASSVVVRQTLTTDKDALRTAIDGISFGGGTALYQGAIESLNLLHNAGATNPAVVILADGGNNQAGTLDEAVRRANQVDIPIFAIGLGNDPALTNIQDLANLTGGIYEHADDGHGLQRIFEAVGVGILDGRLEVNAHGVFDPRLTNTGRYRVTGVLTTTIGSGSVDTPFNFRAEVVDGEATATYLPTVEATHSDGSF